MIGKAQRNCSILRSADDDVYYYVWYTYKKKEKTSNHDFF